MTLTLLFIIAASVICLTSVTFIWYTKTQERKKPHTRSFVIGGLLLLNWALYITNFYGRISPSVGDMIFLPVWFALCFFGLYSSFIEYRNNIGFSFSIASISLFSLMFGFLLILIGSM